MYLIPGCPVSILQISLGKDHHCFLFLFKFSSQFLTCSQGLESLFQIFNASSVIHWEKFKTRGSTLNLLKSEANF